jgi:uncharacterized protein YhaN
MMASLLAIGSVAQANELDDLAQTSARIRDKVDTGIKLVGAGITHSHMGYVTEDGISQQAMIDSAEVTAYNEALEGMAAFSPYGDAQTFLEDKADQELVLMNQAVDTFTEAVVAISTVIEVADMAENAQTPNEQEDIQAFVESNYQELQIGQSDVDTYNQSLDSIETHANNAGAYIGVSQNKEATQFLQDGAASNNSTFFDASLSYDRDQQWVKVGWLSGNASAVFINGTDAFNLDLYVSEEDVFFAGENSEFYFSSPANYYGGKQ